MGFLIRSSTDGGSSWTEQLKVQGGNVEIPNGQVQLSSAKVTGVATPTNAQDAANKVIMLIVLRMRLLRP